MREKIINIFLLLFFAASFLWLSKALLLGYYPDFNTQYYSTIASFTNSNPYKGGVSLFTPQVYPPTTSFFYLPFVFLPIQISSILFTVSSLSCLIITFILLSKTFSINFFSKTNLLIMSLTFIAFPTKFTLGMGQINIIILLLLALSLYCYKKKKQVLSGIFLSLSLLIKLFPLPMVPFLFLNKKILLGFTIGSIVLISLSFIFIPSSILSEFFTKVFPTLISGWKTDYYNQSLSGFIGRGWGVGETTRIVNVFVAMLVLFISYFAIIRSRKNFQTFALQMGTIITLSLVINTFSWQHHFVWLVIPFYALAIFVKKNKSLYLAIILFASYILVVLNFKEPGTLPTILQSHVLFGTLILLISQIKILLTDNRSDV